MGKPLAEWSNRLSIFWLKKHGYLNKKSGYKSGTITWTYGERKNSIGFSVQKDRWGTPENKPYIELTYTNTNRDGIKEYVNYKIELATTTCNYGGNRYWFICPLTKNGNYCGRRVGTIFSIGKWFGCRHCGNIAYDSQMQSEKYKGFVSLPDIERAEEKVKRRYYKGKPTKRYRKVLKLNDQFEYSLIKAYMKIDKDFAREFAGLEK